MERLPAASPILDPWLRGLALIGAITLWRLLMAGLVPVTQDEAYYFDWARTLAWGYFDHPPGVALLGFGTRLAPGSALAARMGGVLAGALTLVLLARLYRNCGLRPGPDLWLALLVAAGTLPGLAGGFITTPDTALGLAWALALHETERALSGRCVRWLTAGVAVGLGLLSKYTMVVMGPVLLWAILRVDPRALRGPWPYLGALLALLVLSPNLVWNAQNDWVSLRFQLGHGLGTDSGALLPGPVPGPAEGVTTIEHLGPESLGDRVASLLAFLGTQLGLWGLLALPLLALPGFARGRHGGRCAGPPLNPRGRALLRAAVWIPLGFFALISLQSDVEANWPAMYLLAAPALVVPLWSRVRLWAVAAALGNLILVTLYGIHAATLALPLSDAHNRILRETHGFRDLAERSALLGGPVYGERYQDVAMLRFYQPAIVATQWPGLSRPSEYLLGRIAPKIDPRALHGPFWLLTRGRSAPAIPGYQVTATLTLTDCPGTPLAYTDESACAKPLHRWLLFAYRPQAP